MLWTVGSQPIAPCQRKHSVRRVTYLVFICEKHTIPLQNGLCLTCTFGLKTKYISISYPLTVHWKRNIPTDETQGNAMYGYLIFITTHFIKWFSVSSKERKPIICSLNKYTETWAWVLMLIGFQRKEFPIWNYLQKLSLFLRLKENINNGGENIIPNW